MVLEFPVMATYAILTQGSRLVYATHGDRYNLESLPPMQPGDILLHGHTHVPVWQPFGQDNYYSGDTGNATVPKRRTGMSPMREFVRKHSSKVRISSGYKGFSMTS